MMTGDEWKAAGMVDAKTGWAVMRDDRRIDDHLYEEEWAARWTASCFEGAYIAKARRVWSIPMKKPMWIIEE